MASWTLTIAIVACLLTVILRPTYAFIVYLAMLLYYPTYLVVTTGTLDISASRIVVSVLLLRCLCSPQIRSRFTWSRLDTLVTLSMAVYVGVFCITRPLNIALIENRGGLLCDSWLAYMTARFCIANREGLTTVSKWVGILLVPLAILGVVEAFTGWRPYLPLTQYCPWRSGIAVTNPRTGLYRSIGSFGHPIMFGACFAIFLPLIYSLRHEHNYWGKLAYMISAIVVIGSLSSMSSGPWVMVIATIFCLAMEKQKGWVKPLLIFLAISCVGIGIISNRPFYHVIASYADPIGGTWWHRCKLIDCAIADLGEWFLLGYGERDPGWGIYLGMGHTDITNQYILNGVQYGIWGIIVICWVFAAVLSGLTRLYNSATDHQVKSLAWALGASMVATMVAFMSVCFFGQMSTLFYCILGMIGSTAYFAEQQVYTRKQIVLGSSYKVSSDTLIT